MTSMLLLLAAFMGFAVSAVRAEGIRPNVLAIMVDDLGYHDLGCQGATDIRTPHIDRLAASGIRFTDGYVTSPQCGPSRAAFLSGMSPHRFGYINNHAQNGLPADEVALTLPEHLQRLGYATGIIGKWHIGFRALEHRAILPGNHPWEQGFDFALTHDSGHSHFYPYRHDGRKWMTERNLEYRLQEKSPDNPAPRMLGDLPPDTYLTDYFSTRAVEFIETHPRKPWFLFLSYNAPHTPCVARKDKLETYAHIKDKLRAQMLAMMESVDDGVGEVVGALERSGQTGRTLVWFLSDNGGPTDKNGSRNDPFSGRKGDVHEGGIRVPFLAAWPGTVAAGRVEPAPVTSLDILPTSLAAAGMQDIPPIHDGRNLLPWLRGAASPPEPRLFWAWQNKSAVRLGDLKETRNANDVTSADGRPVPARVVSDLRTNPRELGELALRDPDSIRLLAGALDAWLAQIVNEAGVYTPVPPAGWTPAANGAGE